MAHHRFPPVALLILVLLALAAQPAMADAGAPDDTLYGRQWALQPGAPLDGQAVWPVADGTGQVVAVLDTGADLDHPDLGAALWRNPAEIPGNGVDDDRDGHVDDVHGVDLVNGDGDPSDDEGHGTHVAGIIAAQRNGEGVVGVAPGARLMIVKVLDAKRRGTADVVGAGIRYALAHGATIINTSVNADGDDPTLDQALAAARAAGVTIVASAGNDNRDLDLQPSWPASSSDDNVVAVAASDQHDLLAAFSNFGRKSVDLAAPGVGIASTGNDGGYELRDGTSMAAPEIAGALALLQSAAPGASQAALRAALLSTAHRPAGLLGVLQSGEVDLPAALRQVAPGAAAAAASVLTLKARVKSRGARRTLVTWTVTGSRAAVSSFRVSGTRGKTLAIVGRAKRGVWLKQRTGRVRITARDADAGALVATTLKLR